jgi:hypothetical protein
MYDKYNDLQWHNIVVVIANVTITAAAAANTTTTAANTTTTHHELGMFWSRLTVSSKVFEVILIHLVYISLLFLVSCCLFLLHAIEQTWHNVHTKFRENRSPSSKETLTHSLSHTHTHSLSLS